MSDQLLCWKCGSLLVELILPMSRREECTTCGADQHVCKMCEYYKPNMANACSEDRAELVSDKERANFCDYFLPSASAFQSGKKMQKQEARRQLAALFGDDLEQEPERDNTETDLSDADAALEELKNLLNKD